MNKFKILLVGNDTSFGPMTAEALNFKALCNVKETPVADIDSAFAHADDLSQIVVYLAKEATTLSTVSSIAGVIGIPLIAPVTAHEASLACVPGSLVFVTNSKDPEHLLRLTEKIMMFREHFDSGIYEESTLDNLVSRPAPLDERM